MYVRITYAHPICTKKPLVAGLSQPAGTSLTLTPPLLGNYRPRRVLYNNRPIPQQQQTTRRRKVGVEVLKGRLNSSQQD